MLQLNIHGYMGGGLVTWHTRLNPKFSVHGWPTTKTNTHLFNWGWRTHMTDFTTPCVMVAARGHVCVCMLNKALTCDLVAVPCVCMRVCVFMHAWQGADM